MTGLVTGLVTGSPTGTRRRLVHCTGAGLLALLPVLEPATAAAATRPAGCAQSDFPAALPRPVTDTPWSQLRAAASRVWPLTSGAGVRVAVVDSGVDPSPAQLAGRVESGADVAGGTAAGTTDCDGHGTAVAGIIGAAPAAGTAFAGLAPGVTIIPVRQSVGGDGDAASAAAAIRRAVDLGATVINTSFGTTVSTPALAAAVRYAQDHDVLVVASAGNDRERGNPRTYPAAYPGVMAVGAIDQNDVPAPFSETGDYLGVVAPGVKVVTLARSGGDVAVDGTSFAAPFVAGTAALVRAYHPRLTATQVKHRIEATADHPAGTLPDPVLGWGVVDPYAAVTAVLPEEGPAGSTTKASVTGIPAGTLTPRPPAISGGAEGIAAACLGAGLVLLVGAGARRRAGLAAAGGPDSGAAGRGRDGQTKRYLLGRW